MKVSSQFAPCLELPSSRLWTVAADTADLTIHSGSELRHTQGSQHQLGGRLSAFKTSGVSVITTTEIVMSSVASNCQKSE